MQLDSRVAKRLSGIGSGCVVALLVLLIPTGARPGSDPLLEWRTLKGPHFLVHYYQGEEELAREFLAIAEEARSRLTAFFGFEPSKEGHLVLVDNVDSANGLTSVVPYNVILLYAYIPDPASELGYWKDWKRILVYHELTHMFQLERITGLLRVVNKVLGRTFLPNGIMPDWFLEGLAVYVESATGSGGRIDSPVFDCWLRLAVAEGRLLRIDELTGAQLTLPRGSFPYMYGSYFLSWLAKKYGRDKLFALVEEQAGKWNPFSLNISARRLFGASFVELYEEWRRETSAKFAKQIVAIGTQGVVEGRRLAFAGEALPAISFTPSGNLLFTMASGRDTPRLVELSSSGETRYITDCRGGCDRPAQNSSGKLYYSSLEYFRSWYYHQDLFMLDRTTGKTVRLTYGERVKDPALSPDGRKVAYVRNVRGRASLIVRDLEDGSVRTLLTLDGGISWPSWSPDGIEIAAVFQYNRRTAQCPTPPEASGASNQEGESRMAQKGGSECQDSSDKTQAPAQVTLVNVETGETSVPAPGPDMQLQPTYSPDGRWLVFSSSEGGVYNIHALDLRHGRRRKLTNVIGAAYAPAVDPASKNVVYASTHLDGYYLCEVELEDVSDRHPCETSPPSIRPPSPLQGGGEKPPFEPPPPSFRAPSSSHEGIEVVPYNPLSFLRPRFLRPSVLMGNFDMSKIELETGGNDPVGQLTYTLRGRIDTGDLDHGASIRVSVDRFFPSISLYAGYSRNTSLARVSSDYLDYVEWDTYASVLAKAPFPSTESSFAVSVGYIYDRFKGEIVEPWEHDPGGLQPVIPASGALGTATVDLSYDDTQRHAWSVVTHKGWRTSAELRVSSPAFGSNWTEYHVRLRLSRYTPMFWADNHVLLTHAQAGWSGGRKEFLHKFSLGGYPDQDILGDLVAGTGVRGTFLRGYPPLALRGNQYYYFTTDYYLPVWRIRRGIDTFPIFLKDVYADLFVNGGTAFYEFDPELILIGVGGELRMKMDIAYHTPLSLILGTAWGLREPGGYSFYFFIGP